MLPDDDACYRALLARDPRFDGVFFVAVSTTGVYCRPICTAKTPGRDRCSFFATAALAERAGFRACFKCRPEIAPGRHAIDVIAPVDACKRLALAAVALVEDGALDEANVPALASRLGVSDRHLRRTMERELGVGPLELAQTRRLAMAKRLLAETSLPATQIAHASGFRSVRRFNAAFLERFGRPPTDLRRPTRDDERDGVTLRLDYRPPFDWEHLAGFFASRAVRGVERVDEAGYARVVRIGDRTGVLRVTPAKQRASLLVTIAPSLVPHVAAITSGVRRMFDLDAEPHAIKRALERDETFRPLVTARPGTRLPGAIDPFEASVRALVGQQVSVSAASTIAGRIAEALGTRVDLGPGLTHAFPDAPTVASTAAGTIAGLGMPLARAEGIVALARAVSDDPALLGRSLDPEASVAALERIRGVGPWTSHYIAMRALHWPDAFPAGDLVVRRALGDVPTRQAIARVAEIRPFRAYAVLHLWRAASSAPPKERKRR